LSALGSIDTRRRAVTLREENCSMTTLAPRTSLTDPLRIAELPVAAAGGMVGVTFCPGKRGDSVFGRPWARDLDADLDVVQR